MSRVIASLLVALLVLGTAAPVAAASVDPRFEVLVTDPTLDPGEETTLTVQLLNDAEDADDVAETAENVRVSLTAGDSPVPVESGTRFVGDLADGAPQQLTFRVTVPPGTPSGEYELTLNVRYEFEDETEHRTVAVPVTVSPVARFDHRGVEADLQVGERGPVSVTLENVGSAVAHEATVVLETADVELTFGGQATRTEVYVGRWAPGETRTIETDLRVAEDASLRNYSLRATIRYEDDAGRQRARTVAMSVRPTPGQAFALRNVSSTLAVGDEGTLQGVVENTGQTVVRNAVVIFPADNANIVPIETEFAVGDLQPGEVATFAFDAEVTDSADAGPRQLSLVVRYRDADDDVRRSDPLDARVQVGPRSDVFDVEPVSATFQAGASAVLELRITNRGDEPVTDVSAKLFADDPLSSSDDEAFIDELGPGESTTVRFALTAAADAVERKVYPVSLDFQYEDAEGDTRLSDSYDVPVRVAAAQGGGAPSLPVIGGVAVLVIAVVGAAVYLRRR